MNIKYDEDIRIIPRNEYKDELETEVTIHLARINLTKLFKVNKKYTHITIPTFRPTEIKERTEWELEEVRRCIEGYDGLPGRFYYFLNHTRIKHKKRGIIRPDFMASQLNFSKKIDEIINTEGKGMVMIKRRQTGASTMMAADNIYDAQFHHDWDIGMNSKSENDSKSFFLTHKAIHRNQSPFLRGMVHSDRRDAMVFGKWIEKEKRWKGTRSTITSVAPTPVAHAGKTYRKLVCDESGEVDIVSIWANAEDTLLDNGRLVCTPFIFGTVGDADGVGQGLMEFWKNHKTYHLEQFALWGYNCLLVDELGNDDLENSVRWIIYERKRRENAAPKIYKKFFQKYPLTEEDAFLSINKVGVGNPILLGKQRLYLMDNPPQKWVGYMRGKMGAGIISNKL